MSVDPAWQLDLARLSTLAGVRLMLLRSKRATFRFHRTPQQSRIAETSVVLHPRCPIG